jgi:hypothetical protein
MPHMIEYLPGSFPDEAVHGYKHRAARIRCTDRRPCYRWLEGTGREGDNS